MKYYIGIDLGGTNIAGGLVDENGKILKKISVPTEVERGESAEKSVMKTISSCRKLKK